MASGLVRYHVLFVIRLVTREVHMAGIIPEPHGPWMDQIARNLTDASEGFLRGCRLLIHDRSTLFTAQFRDILKCAGVDSIRLSERSPNLNAFTERFVKTIKDSCLDDRLFFGESSLRKAASEFVSHYNTERNHQPLDNTIIRAEFNPLPESGPIKCRSRLGGQLHYYYREAA